MPTTVEAQRTRCLVGDTGAVNGGDKWKQFPVRGTNPLLSLPCEAPRSDAMETRRDVPARTSTGTQPPNPDTRSGADAATAALATRGLRPQSSRETEAARCSAPCPAHRAQPRPCGPLGLRPFTARATAGDLPRGMQTGATQARARTPASPLKTIRAPCESPAPSSWQDRTGRGRSSGRPWDSPAATPTSRGTPRETGCSAS